MLAPLPNILLLLYAGTEHGRSLRRGFAPILLSLSQNNLNISMSLFVQPPTPSGIVRLCTAS